MELVIVIPGRPPWIRHDGQWLYLGIRDWEYLRSKSEWRSMLLIANQESVTRFREVVDGYRRWKKRMAAEYLKIGFAPPSGATTKPSKTLIDHAELRKRFLRIRRDSRYSENRPKRRVGKHKRFTNKTLAGTCRRGHARNELTTYVSPGGQLQCRVCTGRYTTRTLFCLIDKLKFRGQPIGKMTPVEKFRLFRLVMDWIEQNEFSSESDARSLRLA